MESYWRGIVLRNLYLEVEKTIKIVDFLEVLCRPEFYHKNIYGTLNMVHKGDDGSSSKPYLPSWEHQRL